MVLVQNAKVIFNEVPLDYPVPGKTTIYSTSDTIDLDASLSGGVLLKVLYLSVDPYMRGKLRDPEEPGPAPPYVIGQPISGFGIGLVFKSEGKNYSEGDHVSYPLMDFAEYTVVPESYLPYLTKIVQHTGLSLSTYLGGAGMPGQTAYYGWKEFCANFKKGGTAFVSGAAGPIGSYVVQLAKRDGLKVIASAGSQAKVNFLKALGADVVVNYKAEGLHLALQKNGPVDVYWDNVGGSTLDAALENASLGAHFVICGMISQYSSMKEGVNMKNLPNIFTQHITLHGFRMAELEGKWKRDFNETVPEMLASGEIKYHENIVKGLDKAGDALLDLMAGNSMGKTIILVSN